MTRRMDLMVVAVVLVGLGSGWGLKTVAEADGPRFSDNRVSLRLPVGWRPLGEALVPGREPALFRAQHEGGPGCRPFEVRLTAKTARVGLQQAYLKDYWSVSQTLEAFQNRGTFTETLGSDRLLVWRYSGVLRSSADTDLPQVIVGSIRYFRGGDQLYELRLTGDGADPAAFGRLDQALPAQLTLFSGGPQ